MGCGLWLPSLCAPALTNRGSRKGTGGYLRAQTGTVLTYRAQRAGLLLGGSSLPSNKMVPLRPERAGMETPFKSGVHFLCVFKPGKRLTAQEEVEMAGS